MEWTDDVIGQLRAYWAEGLSTAEIGRRLGVTKNAIVGKAHRLDLPARPSPIRRDPDAEIVQRGTARRVEGPTLPPLPSTVAEPETILSAIVIASSGTGSSVPAMEAARSAPALLVPSSFALGMLASGMPARPSGDGPAAAYPSGADGVSPSRATLPSTPPPRPPMPPVPPRVPLAVPAQPRAVMMAPRPAPPPRQALPVMPRSSGRVVTCCWPIGEPGTRDFHFCDVPSEPGRPYCEDHVKVAYVRVRDRREDAA